VCFLVDCLLAGPKDSQPKSTTRTNCCIPPDDGLQICPKHEKVDWRNKLGINSTSSWFLWRWYIEMHSQQTIKFTRCVGWHCPKYINYCYVIRYQTPANTSCFLFSSARTWQQPVPHGRLVTDTATSQKHGGQWPSNIHVPSRAKNCKCFHTQKPNAVKCLRHP
jgi:hypothetical protein